MASFTASSTYFEPGDASIRPGTLVSCAACGDGSDSMTETRSAVDSGSHAENKAVKIARGSLDLVTCSGRLMLSDFTIFSVNAGSLEGSVLDWNIIIIFA